MKTLVVILIAVAGALLLWPPPPRWNPWAPLDVRQPTNILTGYKLSRLRDDPALCEQALATSTLRTTVLASNAGSGQCPLNGVLRVQGGDTGLSSSFIATCPMAVAYAIFETQILQPSAQAMFGQPVSQVDHLGSFACRNVYNRSEGRLSQHATANALDIAGFRLADGRRITVLADWGKDSPNGRFLQAVHDGACQPFNTVLGPQYNAAHRNHFHLDMGRWRVCR